MTNECVSGILSKNNCHNIFKCDTFIYTVASFKKIDLNDARDIGTEYPVLSRSHYFRVFRGLPSARENKMTAKSANWSRLRKSETFLNFTPGGLQG